MRILVVASRTLAGFIQVGLNDEGHVVSWTDDYATARRYLDGEPWDAVIADMNADASREIVDAYDRGRCPPLLALMPGVLIQPRAVPRAAHSHLVKPFKFQALMAWLSSLTRADPTVSNGGLSIP